MDSDAPRRIGNYEVRGTPGRGGSGVVYDGWDPAIGRRVAIETFQLDHDGEAAAHLSRFRQEAGLASRLRHPNIATVYGFGETPSFAFVATQHVAGQTLQAIMANEPPMRLARAAGLLADILDALYYAHGQGVVHRDIRPANIIVAPDGHAILAGFGFLQREGPAAPETVAYKAPEQLRGEPSDSRADIYACGAVLYELLTRSLPFEGSTDEIISGVLGTHPAAAPSSLCADIPHAMDAVVAQAMARRQQDRFATVAAFADAIGLASMTPQGVQDPPALRLSHQPASGMRRSLAWPLGAAGAALLLGIGAWLLPSRETGPAQPQPLHHEAPPPVLAQASPPVSTVPASPPGPPPGPVVVRTGPVALLSPGPTPPQQTASFVPPPPPVATPPAPPLNGSAPFDTCDKLAAPPRSETRGVTPVGGVAFDKMDAAAALAACQNAMKRWPAEPRFVAFAARASVKAGKQQDALRLYSAAASKSDPYAEYVMAMWSWNGTGGLPRDEAQALFYLRLSAFQGFQDAESQLGVVLSDGLLGQPQDLREAARLYRLAAAQGNALGQLRLGMVYNTGVGGVTADVREAARLWRAAAAQGLPLAKFLTAASYLTGTGVEQNIGEALRLMKQAAAEGDARAQDALGSMVKAGFNGLAKDDKEAVRLFRLSAAQGDQEGELDLGHMYEEGRGGVGPDTREAARYYAMSAAQNYAGGQVSLAALYEQGKGVARNGVEAMRLYRAAAAQGNQDAKVALERLGSR